MMNIYSSDTYLSKILNNKVYSNNNEYLGKLVDIGVLFEETKNPSIIIAKIKLNNKFSYIAWENLKVSPDFNIKCESYVERLPNEKIVFLARYILDKQIIDINGKKVVRVNDVKLLLKENEGFVVAVDIGVKGLLRRLIGAKFLNQLLKLLHKDLNSKLILWNDIETIIPSNDNIVVSKTYKKLSKLHTSDLADILEDFDTKTSISIFSSLDKDKAADVLEEIEPEIQRKIIQTMPLEQATDLLEEMPPDEVADILQDLNTEQAEKLLKNMEKESSEEVRELLEYDEDTSGSLMNKDYVVFREDSKVFNIINDFRNSKIAEEIIFYIYVVDQENKLKGVMSLPEVLSANPDSLLKDVMTVNYIFAYDTDLIHELIKIVTKYNLVEIPILTKEKELIGCVLINDILDELVRNKQLKI